MLLRHMRTVSVSFLLVLFSLPLFAQGFEPCSATISFQPSRPTPGDPIRANINGGCNCALTPPNPIAYRSGSTILLNSEPPFSGACLTVPSSWSLASDIGPLPAGVYNVKMQWGSMQIAQTTLIVGDGFRVTPTFGKVGAEVLITGPGIGNAAEMTIGGVHVAPRVINANAVAVTVPSMTQGRKVIAILLSDASTVTLPFDVLQFAGQERFTRVLFPVATSAPGSAGAQWHSANILRNNGAVPLVLDILPPLAPGIESGLPTFNENRGYMIGVATEQLAQAAFASHARDTSRNALDAGTEIRVVTEHSIGATATIAAIPVAANYRYLLRILDIDSFGPDVHIEARSGNGTLLGATDVTLDPGPSCPFLSPPIPCNTGEPGFAAIDLRNVIGDYNGSVTVTLSAPDFRIWGFVTATNNDTHHVTTYSPQP
jgi:hypothetical protein